MDDPRILCQEIPLPSNTTISAFTATDNKICFGSFTGSIYVSTIKDDGSLQLLPGFPIEVFSKRITSVSFNRNADFLLTSSMQGELSLIDISQAKQVNYHAYGQYISTAVIDPALRSAQFSCFFADGSNNIFRTSNRKLSFSSRKFEIMEVSQKDSDIDQISWRDDLVVWVSQLSISIYNARSDQLIKRITLRLPTITEEIKYIKSSIIFRGSTLIGAGYGSNYQKIDSNSMEPELQKLLPGISRSSTETSPPSDKAKDIIVLVSQNSRDFADVVYRPDHPENPIYVEFEDLRDSSEGKILATIPISSDKSFDPSSHMSLSPSKDSFFFAIRAGIFRVSRRTVPELITYYLEAHQTDTAMTLLREHRDQVPDSSGFMQSAAEQYLSSGETEKAVEVFDGLNTAAQWEKVIDFFETQGKLDSIAKIIPLDSIKLNSDVTTKILSSLCKNNKTRFCEVIVGLTPATDFNVSTIASELTSQISRDPNDPFLPHLLRLKHSMDQHKEAFDFAILRGYSETLKDIAYYKQWDYVLSNFIPLLKLFPETFSGWLLENKGVISPQSIITKIQNEQKNKDPSTFQLLDDFKLEYLMELWKSKDPMIDEFATEFALMLIRKTRPETLEFLKSTTKYDFNKAREEAQKYQMMGEVAYLCRWTGAAEEGLDYLLSNASKTSPETVVGFAKDCNDKKVWEKLTQFSYNNASYLQYILENLNDLSIKPAKFIEGIPDNKIDQNFPETALKVIKEFRRRLQTASLTQEIVAKDAFGAFQRSFEKNMAGHVTTF